MKKRYVTPSMDIAFFEEIGCTMSSGQDLALSALDDGVGTITIGPVTTTQSKVATFQNVLSYEE